MMLSIIHSKLTVKGLHDGWSRKAWTGIGRFSAAVRVSIPSTMFLACQRGSVPRAWSDTPAVPAYAPSEGTAGSGLGDHQRAGRETAVQTPRGCRSGEPL